MDFSFSAKHRSAKDKEANPTIFIEKNIKTDWIGFKHLDKINVNNSRFRKI